jgi:hypothetical protein
VTPLLLLRAKERMPLLVLSSRPLGTTSKSAERSPADACFALAERVSHDAGPAHLVLVRSEHPTRGLGDVRLNGQKQERGAGGAA